MQESHPLTRLLTKMSKKWPWTSKMYDSCLPKGQAGIQVFCVSCWGSKLTAGSQTCELQNNNMCSSCETHVIYFGMWNTVKKKPAFRYQTSLNLFMWKFLWIYGELFFICLHCSYAVFSSDTWTFLLYHVKNMTCRCMNS